MGSGRLPGASFISDFGRWGVKCALAGPKAGSKAALFCQLSAISLMSHVSFGQLTSKAPFSCSLPPSPHPFLSSGFGFCYWRDNSPTFQKEFCCTTTTKKSKMLKEQLPKLTQFKQGRAGTATRKSRSLTLLPSHAQALYKQQQTWAYPDSPSTPNPPPLTRGSPLYLHPPYICYRDLSFLAPASHTCSPKQRSSFG